MKKNKGYISLTVILPDTTYQLRESSLGKNIPGLYRLIGDDIELDPIIVLKTPRGYLIIDGFQRVEAMRKAKGENAKIHARIIHLHENNSKTLVLMAIAANLKHGAQIELADRRKMALRLLEEDPKMSDNSVAKAVGLGARTIGNYRKENKDLQSETRVGADGRETKVKKQKDTKKSSNKEKTKESTTTESSEHSIDDESAQEVKPSSPSLLPTTLPVIANKDEGSTESISPLAKALGVVALICRKQAKEIELRADFIEKLQSSKSLTTEEIEFIHIIAEEAEALEMTDSPHFDERAQRIQSASMLLSQLIPYRDGADEFVG
jgi:ParB-like chromosome segregation protein Spo0J